MQQIRTVLDRVVGCQFGWRQQILSQGGDCRRASTGSDSQTQQRKARGRLWTKTQRAADNLSGILMVRNRITTEIVLQSRHPASSKLMIPAALLNFTQFASYVRRIGTRQKKLKSEQHHPIRSRLLHHPLC